MESSRFIISWSVASPVLLSLMLALVFVLVMPRGAAAQSQEQSVLVAADDAEELGPSSSFVTVAPLEAGEGSLALGGGLAVVLPFGMAQGGVGLGGGVDMTLRYDTILGIAHTFGLKTRWAFAEAGGWHFGLGLSASYFLFGLQGERPNYTSTFYLEPELAVSGPLTDFVHMVIGLSGELDIFEHRIVDDNPRFETTGYWDATTVRLGVLTPIRRGFDIWFQLRVRVPTETFVFEDTPLFVTPFVEAGTSWTF